MHNYFDKIIIGGGLYGLYSADFCMQKGEKILLLEYDPQPFMRATYINQARVHMGYHYPRSYTTAVKSAGYYDLFKEDYSFCVKEDFEKIYAISKNFSWTDANQFARFCSNAGIPCKPVSVGEYFKEDLVEGAFTSRESTYDAALLKNHLKNRIDESKNVVSVYNARIASITIDEGVYRIAMEDGQVYSSGFVLNATYGSVNQIALKAAAQPIDIKYELCEIILCKVSERLRNVGITVMDGPFFSLMPFGKTGYHSLTAVPYTPHKTSTDILPVFDCQQKRTNNRCSPQQLANCNTCDARPKTSWKYMVSMAKKYLSDDIKIEYVESLFSIKTVLKSAEVDDARPTVIKQHTAKPSFVSVLSGKINTVYDLNDILSNGDN